MKKLFLVAALTAFPILAKAGEITISYLTPPAASSLAVETVGSTTSASNVVSSSLSFTTSSNTKLLLAAVGYRRNASQTVTSVTFNGTPLVLSTAVTSFSLYSGLYYLQNPPATTANIVVTLSGASAGLGSSALSFTGTASAPSNADFDPTQIVATSSATATTNVGDILVDFEVKQDTTTAQPTLNTAGAVSRVRWPNTGATAGDTFWADLNTNTATGTPTTTNLSWTGGTARNAHTWAVITP